MNYIALGYNWHLKDHVESAVKTWIEATRHSLCLSTDSQKGLPWGQFVTVKLPPPFTVINSFYGNRERWWFQSWMKRYMKHAQKIFSVRKQITFIFSRARKNVDLHSIFPWTNTTKEFIFASKKVAFTSQFLLCH